MTAKIKVDRLIGLTDEIDENLKIACEFTGMTISQFGRQAILEKLIKEGYMERPKLIRPQKPQPKIEITEAAE